MPEIVNRQTVELVLYPVEQFGEADSCPAADYAEQQIKWQPVQDIEINIAHGEHRPLAKKHGPDALCGERGGDEQAE